MTTLIISFNFVQQTISIRIISKSQNKTILQDNYFPFLLKQYLATLLLCTVSRGLQEVSHL